MGTIISTRPVEVKDLRGLDLFAGLDDSELAKIVGLCRWETFQKNTIIYTPGTPLDDIYFLVGKNDAIQLELPVEGFSTNIVTHVLRKGEIFGWSNFIPHQLRTTMAKCLEDTEIISVKGSELMKLFEKETHMGFLAMKNLSIILCTRLTYTSVSLRHTIRQILKCEQAWKI
jgi:CRP-like cAMP-binding protein